MANQSVSWKEGMFLLPQHFQTQELFADSQNALGSHVDTPYNYGVVELGINEDAFASWQIQVQKAKGRFQDGTLFSFEPNELATFDLNHSDNGEVKQALLKGEIMTLYLAVSRIIPGFDNISEDNPRSRFNESDAEIHDHRKEGEARTIVLKSLNAKLTFSNDKTRDHEYLPVAKIMVHQKGDVPFPKLANDFYPPCTSSIANRHIQEFCRSMEHELTGYLSRLTRYLNSINGDRIEAIGKAQSSLGVYRLMALGELRAWVSCLNRSLGRHPFEVYQYLCSMIGKLALANQKSKDLLPEIEAYDHENIYESLSWAWEKIRVCMDEPEKAKVEEIPLEIEPGSRDFLLTAHIPSKYAESEKFQIFFGVYFKELNTRDANELLPKSGKFWDRKKFYWKMGAVDRIEEYFKDVQKGVTLAADAPRKTISGLSEGTGFVFYEIKQDPYWKEARETNTLCFRADAKQLQKVFPQNFVAAFIDGTGYKFRLSLFVVLPDDEI